MITTDPKAYQPRYGDICIQEMRPGRFNMYWYDDEDGYGWEQRRRLISAEEVQEFIKHPYALIGTSKGKGRRRYYRQEYIPQFPDGSGWDLEETTSPCFYEHVTQAEVQALERAEAERLYKIVCIIAALDQPHKNTYFVKGAHLASFFEDRFTSEIAEYAVSIERVESMPSTDEKLTH